MKTLFGLFCLLTTCFLAAAFQPSKKAVMTLADWVTCQVDNRLSVQVPVQPTETNMMKLFTSNGITPPAAQVERIKKMKLLTATDGLATYMISRSPIDAEVDIESPGNRLAFYNRAIEGLMRTERGTLLQRSAFTLNNVEGVQMSYRGLHKVTGKMIIKHTRLLTIDQMMYLLAAYPVNSNDSTGISITEQRTKFFNSMAYKPVAQEAK